MDEYVFRFIDKHGRESQGTAYAKTMAEAREYFLKEQGDWCKRVIEITNLTELRQIIRARRQMKEINSAIVSDSKLKEGT